MFISKEESDVNLYVKGRKFSAHRTILAARCSVFAAMFDNDTEEKKTGVVKITDYDPVSFEMFLSFLYSGKVDFAKCNVCELYKISYKYDVAKLLLFCIHFMIQNLSIDNFYEILILSDQFKEKELFGRLQSFFNKNFEKIISSSNWDNFSEKHFRLVNILLKSMAPKISITE